MFRRLASVALSSALTAGVLVGIGAPAAEAAGTCADGTSPITVSGTEYCIWKTQQTSDASWIVPYWVTSIDILVVGGGAGGRSTSSSTPGGGGGGGDVYGLGGITVSPGQSLTAKAGSGGSPNSDGGDSTLKVGGTTYTGSGGNTGNSLNDGGSSGINVSMPSYSKNQSYSGKGGNSSGLLEAAGGGSGAGGQGQAGTVSVNNNTATGGNGGPGFNIRDAGFASNSTLVACGGGGGAYVGDDEYGVTEGDGGCVAAEGRGAWRDGGNTADLRQAATDGVDPGSGGGGGAKATDAASGAVGIVYIRYLALVKTLSLTDGAGQQPAAPAPSGYPLSTQPVVQLRDGTSNDPVADEDVVASTSTSGCTLAGTTTQTTDASGVATFTDLALSRVAGSCTITFTNTGNTYSAVTSSSISVTAGPAVGANSTVAVADASLQVADPGNTSVVTVQLKDDSGNSLGSSQYASFGPYDVSLGVTGAAGEVGSVTNNGNGTYSATFTGGTETGTATVGGSMSLGSGATAGTAGSLVADTVEMDPGTKVALAIGTEPAAGAAYSGQVLDTPPVVNVVDAFGNTVTDATDAVTAGVTLVSGSGSPSLGGTNPKSASSGVATFTNLAVTGNATSTYRLNFTATGLTGVSSSTFALAKEPQTVSLGSGASPTPTFGDAPFVVSARALDASGAETGLPITFASSNEAVCTVSGAENPNTGTNTYSATVAITGAGGGGGTCVVTASQAGDDDYAAATSTGLTYTVARASQSPLSIVSGNSAVYGTNLTLVGAGGSSSAALSWGTSSGPCTVTGSGTTGTLVPTGVGTCVVTLNRAADDNYNAATQVTQPVQIAKRDQVVSFTSLVPTQPKSFQTYTAQFSSSLGASYVPSVSVTTGNGTICSAVDNGDGTATVSFLASGTCTLTATENGDANTNAGSATQTIVVDSINQNITFSAIADQVFGVPPIQLAATASSGRPVTYTSSTTSVCTVGASSGLLTIKDKGTCTITVSRGADAQYAAANSVQRTFVVAAALATAPHISSVSPGDTTITTSFVAPGFTGAPSETIAGYEVTATPTSGSAITQPCSDTTAPLVCTMTGLANGTDHRITVAAVNSSGVGASSSASSLLRPATAANAVTGAYAVPGINGTDVHLYWTQLDSTVATLGGGSFTRYDVYVREVGGSWPGSATFTTSTITDTDNNFTGLTTGQSYEFKIVAITTANSTELTGNTTIVTEYPSTVPAAVTELTLTETSDTSVVITWEVPDTDGGATITSYDVAVPGLRDCAIDPTTDANRCVFTGLSLGRTYAFTVTATNRMGEGVASRVAITTPPPPANDAYYDGPGITDQTVPDAVLTGGASWMVTENGRPVLTSLEPNVARTGWIITGSGFTQEVLPLNANKQPVGLGPTDQLEVPQGGWIAVTGNDYRDDTLVKAFLVPKPSATTTGATTPRTLPGTLYLGHFDVSRRGTIDGEVYVPAYASAGNWVLQLVGQENISTLRTTNVALTVIDSTPGVSTFLNQRAGFFKGGKAVLSKKGKKKLRALINGVPADADIAAITITGVSVSLDSSAANLRLAGKRADRIAKYLDKKGLSGTIDVAVYTQTTIGTGRAANTAPQPLQTRSGKPLTTTSITYEIVE